MWDDVPGAGGGDETTPTPAPWHEGLAADLKGDKTISHYIERNDLNGMATALVNAERKIGERPLSVPANDAGEEEWNGVWTALGRPESAEGYQLVLPEGYEPTELEAETHPKIRAAFHKAGLTPRQAQVLQTEYNAVMADFGSQLRAVEDASEREGQSRIDRLFPDRRAFEADQQAGLHFAFGGDADEIETFQKLRLTNGSYAASHPVFRMLLARIGNAMSEDQRAGIVDPPERRYGTIEDIDAQIAKNENRMANDKGYPLHPEYKGPQSEIDAASDERHRLFQLRGQKRRAAGL